MAEWRTIETFPKYEMDELGTIRNKETGHIKSQSMSGGILTVVLSDDTNTTRTRSVKKLRKLTHPETMHRVLGDDELIEKLQADFRNRFDVDLDEWLSNVNVKFA